MTAAVLKFDKQITDEQIEEYILKLKNECRSAMCTATAIIGCGINPTKSEVILPPNRQIESLGKEGKNDFVWLGYSLKLTTDMYLSFTDDRAMEKFEATQQIINDIFQYVFSPFIRWKIFKIFVSPIIEWFLFATINKPMHELAAANYCDVFQMNMLCSAIKVTRTVKREDLENILNEKPTLFKTASMCSRLAVHLDRNYDSLIDTTPQVERCKTRNRAEVAMQRLNADKKDIGDRILIYKNEFKLIPKETKKQYQEKYEFDLGKINSFVNRNNQKSMNEMLRRTTIH